MGIKYTRDYPEIINELAGYILEIPDLYETFEMDLKEWKASSKKARSEYAKTLADDVFYALGTEGEMQVGSGKIEYKDDENSIIVNYKDGRVEEVRLS